jgi:hypothetical protein
VNDTWQGLITENERISEIRFAAMNLGQEEELIPAIGIRRTLILINFAQLHTVDLSENL